jgi:hypothetical protein
MVCSRPSGDVWRCSSVGGKLQECLQTSVLGYMYRYRVDRRQARKDPKKILIMTVMYSRRVISRRCSGEVFVCKLPAPVS